ncbi:MAG: hypothetical protein KDB23_31515, partial [Planctomycetales bacterium]|nr:hypothetical protein [Planctomycetales bacterium]
MPTLDDDVTLSTGNSSPVVIDIDALAVRTLVSESSLTVRGQGHLVVTDDIQFRGDVTLLVDGNDALLTATRNANIDGTSLVAKNGGKLLLNGLKSYSQGDVAKRAQISASGNGSIIDLSSVLDVVGTSRDLTSLVIEADAGGYIDLGQLRRASIPNDRDNRRNGIQFIATGPGSQIDLSVFNDFVDDSIFGGPDSTLEVHDGGEVRAPGITRLKNIGIVIAGADSILPIQQYTEIIDGSIRIAGTGNARTFHNVTSIDNSNVTATDGATLRLPKVSKYTRGVSSTTTYTPELSAVGAGSFLDTSSLVQLISPPLGLTTTRIRAEDGGAVDLTRLLSAVIPDGGNSQNGIQFIANGPSSLIDLSALGEFLDGSALGLPGSSLEVRNGGEVRAPGVVKLKNIGIVIEGADSILPIQQYTEVIDGSIRISGAGNVRSFENITSINNSSVNASGGATLRLPQVREYVRGSNSISTYVPELSATGS